MLLRCLPSYIVYREIQKKKKTNMSHQHNMLLYCKHRQMCIPMDCLSPPLPTPSPHIITTSAYFIDMWLPFYVNISGSTKDIQDSSGFLRNTFAKHSQKPYTGISSMLKIQGIIIQWDPA